MNKAATAKIEDDYLQFIKAGVLNGSIPSVIPDSGVSLSTSKNVDDYEAAGKKSSKEF